MRSESELGKILRLMLNVGMILTGAGLSRRVFAVLGGLGAFVPKALRELLEARTA